MIWRQLPKMSGRGHYGHRLAFSPDGRHLFISSGDRQHFDPAQDMNANLGKILRLNPDGSVPADNPFAEPRRQSPRRSGRWAIAIRSASPSRRTGGCGRSRWARRAATR